MKRAVVSLIGIVLLAVPALAFGASSNTPQTIYTLLGTTTPVESSTAITHWIAAFAPQASPFAKPVFGVIDSGRTWIASLLQGQIEWVAPNLPGNALIHPASGKELSNTGQFDWHKALATIEGVMWTVYFYLLTIARYLIAKAAFFYSLLLGLLLLVLWKLFRRLRKKKRR